MQPYEDYTIYTGPIAPTPIDQPLTALGKIISDQEQLIAELTVEVSGWRYRAERLQAAGEQACALAGVQVERAERAEAALAFYADAANYELQPVGPPCDGCVVIPVIKDCGETAREALSDKARERHRLITEASDLCARIYTATGGVSSDRDMRVMDRARKRLARRAGVTK